ncbi:hypothetical protein [Methanolapillus millepedarum]|uniref:Quinolinate phosphoribosyl transferase N-terminal domain-containing protein n=1 Tax=Methanolapillus millepedarum TaxID=3028296 RepID=A0AA96ZUZ3_9EURY|nr:hypothetical protein MsAc7_03880 [Methanosarcinaceae archaeon Ac7]
MVENTSDLSRTKNEAVSVNLEKYTDKYFLRAYEILKKDNLNPYVRAQVFVRKGPGFISGMSEVVSFILNNSDLIKNGGRIYALSDGETYSPLETILMIEGHVLDIIRLETIYLGMISSALAIKNDNRKLDFNQIENNMKQIVSAAGGRPVTYFGARHWHYSEDEKISKAAISGGAAGAATDAGAVFAGQKGVGTIPHALENIYAWKFGKENAVLKSTLAFDKYMPKDISRIALIDYNNREIDDTLCVAKSVSSLFAIRVDTCGENVAQGALSFSDFENKSKKEKDEMIRQFFNLPAPIEIPLDDEIYWFGTGVSISEVYVLRKALNDNGFSRIQIMLSSGFGKLEKINAFSAAEKMLGIKLYDSLGVGGIYESRDATMDIVAVGNSLADMVPVSKIGRMERPNPRLKFIHPK